MSRKLLNCVCTDSVLLPLSVAFLWTFVGGPQQQARVVSECVLESSSLGNAVTNAVVGLQGLRPSGVSSAIREMTVQAHVRANSLHAFMRSGASVHGLEDGAKTIASGLQLGVKHVLTAVHCLPETLRYRVIDKKDVNGWFVCSDPDLKVTNVDVFGGAGSMTSSVATVFLPADDGDDGVALVEMVEHLTDRPPGSKEEVIKGGFADTMRARVIPDCFWRPVHVPPERVSTSLSVPLKTCRVMTPRI